MRTTKSFPKPLDMVLIFILGTFNIHHIHPISQEQSHRQLVISKNKNHRGPLVLKGRFQNPHLQELRSVKVNAMRYDT